MAFRNYESQELGKIIKSIINEHGWGSKLDEQNLIKSWEKIAGRLIAKNTIDLRLRSGRLYLKLDSAAVKHEISYAKELLIKNINEELDKEVVREIIIS